MLVDSQLERKSPEAVSAYQSEQSNQPESMEQELARLRLENLQLKEKLARAEAEAAIDPLTELPTEKVTKMTLEKDLAEVRRGQKKLLVLYLDLDHFKEVNDTWGHAQGDKVLQDWSIAARWKLRSGDSLGRLHGEEFIILARLENDFLPKDIQKIIERVNEGTHMVNRAPKDNEVQPQTVSMGGVIVDSTSDFSVEEILTMADKNLYHSKETGRNKASVTTAGGDDIEIFDPVNSSQVPA